MCAYVFPFTMAETSFSANQTKENDKTLTHVKAFSSNCLVVFFILLQRKILSGNKIFSKLKNQEQWLYLLATGKHK